MDKKEIRAEWIRRLRSGEISQTQRVLGKTDGSRCCLGVICDIAVDAGIIYPPEDENGHLVYYDEWQVLPDIVQDWVGLRQKGGKFPNDLDSTETMLAKMNDDGYTFSEIANIIESEPEGLFVS